MNVTAIILAAGESRRLGTPKQGVELDGKTLVQHAVDRAHTAGCAAIHVVSGACPIEVNGAALLHNPDWSTGIGSSIATGVAALPACDAVLVMLCDQPFIPVSHYQQLIDQYSQTGISATRYPDAHAGVPACFAACHFQTLSQLEGAEGARGLLRALPVTLLDCPQAELDIDTADDLAQLVAGKEVKP